MKIIIIKSKSHGDQNIVIDDEMYDMVCEHNWYIIKSGNNLYAVRNRPRLDVNKETQMHRMVINAKKGDVVDHKDRNSLNNTLSNLRICNYSQNNANKKSKKDSSSKYLGVEFRSIPRTHFIKSAGKFKTYYTDRYIARISTNNKQVHVGAFKFEEDAARAYDEAAKKYHGEFANLNFK